MSAVIVYSAVHVGYFGRKPCSAGCKWIFFSVLDSRSFSSVLAAGHSRLIGR